MPLLLMRERQSLPGDYSALPNSYTVSLTDLRSDAILKESTLELTTLDRAKRVQEQDEGARHRHLDLTGRGESCRIP